MIDDVCAYDTIRYLGDQTICVVLNDEIRLFANGLIQRRISFG